MKSYLLLGKAFPFDYIPDCEITTLTDHSERTDAESVFVCIRGQRFDGHTLAPRAYERGCRIFVAEELGTKLGIGGVDGNVNGTDVQVDDALRLALGKVGERDVIAHQEAEACIVILKIERLSHIGRHLIDKAEQTMVGAGARLIHQIGIKVEPEILALFLFHRLTLHIHYIRQILESKETDTHRQNNIVNIHFKPNQWYKIKYQRYKNQYAISDFTKSKTLPYGEIQQNRKNKI